MHESREIANTYVSSIDTEKREVRLEGSEAVYHYADDSMILLLQKAMTRRATFIIRDNVVSWIELQDEAHRHASEDRKKLRNLLQRTVDETLEQVFNEESARTIQVFLKNTLHITPTMIVENPEAFSSGLRRLLGSGATVVESLIVENLCQKFGSKFEEKKDCEFSDYIEEFKKRLDERRVLKGKV
jgi:hypothetical protein